MGWSCTRRQPPPRLFQRWSECPEALPLPLAASPRASTASRSGHWRYVRCELAAQGQPAGSEQDPARESEAAPSPEPAARGRGADNGRAGAGLGRARGRPRRPPHTCAASRVRGTRAAGPAGGARHPRVESPRAAPQRGGLRAGTRVPSSGAGRAETPAAPRGRGRTGEGAAAAPLLSFISCLQQKGTRFSFSEISVCLIVFRSFLSASRTDLNWGRTEMAKVRPRVG